MLSSSPDTILIGALVVLVAIIALFVLHILLAVQQLVRLGEMRKDYPRGESGQLSSSYEEDQELKTEAEDERLEQASRAELEAPESLPVAGLDQQQGQNVEIQRRADKLEDELLRFKQDYRKLEAELKQIREHQLETDQEKVGIREDLQKIRQILDGRPSSAKEN